ncbi:hypothetical protein HU200_008936 [Digitaria exilis]|uniref:Glucose/Sorbosone dehydrogenase domain-containing protein n=1 Tax=Digitaria exilis TaxID=1010633 RepID=A0A835FNA0_9POAL|nr:hypothetical protein HU200_008936 [Digitaria exilis]
MRRPGGAIAALLLLSVGSLLLPASLAFPLCTDARAPVLLNTTLKFCAGNGNGSSSCCDAAADAALGAQFDAMNVSDTACAAVLKSILCAKCSPYSADLFDAGPKIRTIPILCNSTSSATSAQSKDTTQYYCKHVWETCKDVKIINSPFQPSLQGSAPPPSSPSKLSDAWQSVSDFCSSFGGAPNDQSACFSGNTVSFNTTQPSPSPKGICLERIGDGSYLNMAPHPDGSNRIFLGSQAGKIWLATVPEQGSGGTLQFEEASPFVDLTDQVHYDSAFGLMGMAFHPEFATNGRFFASYNCDRTKSSSCTGRCSCNSDVGCDPTKLGTDNGALPCQYQVVVSEYSAKGSSAHVSEATSADPSEVTRIFTMGLPYTSQHGGQVLFGPDGYLYLMMGDGGGKGDPFNFAQNKKSLLGKIMRLDIDNTPKANDISNTSLWGNYSIPKDNPYVDDSELEPEIWALGLRNPWRCSFDSERPSYFYCGDVGQDRYEEVDLISKGGNYGWRALEGPLVYSPQWAPGGNTSLNSINAIPPIMGYSHSDVNKNIGSASIMGGYVYRGSADPCLYGRYLYADLYALAMWTGTESPENSGNYTSTLIPFSCSKESPMACETAAGSPLPSLGYIYSFGEDNSKDIYVLASKGVYRVVRPSLCSYSCPTEKAVTTTPPGPSSKAASTAVSRVLLLLSFVVMFWVLMR